MLATLNDKVYTAKTCDDECILHGAQCLEFFLGKSGSFIGTCFLGKGCYINGYTSNVDIDSYITTPKVMPSKEKGVCTHLIEFSIKKAITDYCSAITVEEICNCDETLKGINDNEYRGC